MSELLQTISSSIVIVAFVLGFVANQLYRKNTRLMLRDIYRSIFWVREKLKGSLTSPGFSERKEMSWEHWLMLGVFCLFSAYFWLSLLIYPFVLIEQGMPFIKSVLVIAFIFGLMMAGRYYQVCAQKIRFK